MVRRFFFYLAGFTIGAIFIYFLLLRGRSFNFWMPGERVKTELIVRKPVMSEKANCLFECLGLNNDTLPALIKTSKVNFKESKVHEKPCKYYLLENNDGNTRMEFSVCDTMVTLLNITQAGKTCNCE